MTAMFRILLGLAVAANAYFTIYTGVNTNPPQPHLKWIGIGMGVVAMLLLFRPRDKR